jgi:RNA polymerase sigma-70 factor (subfamily 1)
MPAEADRLAESMLLLERAQDGDPDALDRLVGRYYGRVLHIVRLRMGPWLRAHVESGDILQETFAAAVTGLDRFEPRDEASLIHWLSQVAENRIRKQVERLQAAKRDARREVPMAAPSGSSASGPQAWEPASPGRSASSELSDAEWIAILEGCIHALPDTQRDAILLRNYAEASWQTVADTLALSSPDAARMAHKRAMKALVEAARVRGEGP